MTKPIASIALMQLYEQGRFLLRDPISRWIPAFAKTRVYTGGDRIDYETREASREITVHDLLTHMSGLSYDFHVGTAVSGIYRQRGFNWGAPTGLDLGEMCDLLADLPLVFDPGSEWNYSHSTDVVGRLVEVISGQSLDEYLAEHILGPLGMVDTAFWVAPDNVHRFAGNYTFTPGSMKRKLVDDAQRSPYLSRPKLLSGGGGLVSHHGRLPPVHANVARRWHPRRSAHYRPGHAGLHDPQSHPRRDGSQRVRQAVVFRDCVRGCGLRARLFGGHQPCQNPNGFARRESTAGVARPQRRSGWIRQRTSR